MNEKFLLDNWQEFGTSIEDFEKTITEVANHTTFISPINSRDITVLSYCQTRDDGKMACFALSPLQNAVENMKVISPTVLNINPQSVLSKGNFEDLLKEVRDDVGVLFLNEAPDAKNGKKAKCLFVSKKVITHRLQPFGVNGDFLSQKSFERDQLIAKLFGEKGLWRTLVTRNYNGIVKVFSMLGERYKHLPQDILLKIYEELTGGGIMGRPECKCWEMTHFMTRIQIEFPEKADEFQTVYGLSHKIVPGITLETSDTGDCSVRVKGTWRIKNSTSIHEEVQKKHQGDWSVEELLEDTNNDIFSEYTKLPEALCDLMSCDITDPKWDLSVPAERALNGDLIKSVLKDAFKKLKIVEAIGKQAEKSLFEQLYNEFDSSIAYTAYDIALGIMSTPERVTGLHALTQEKLAKAVSKAPYIKYEPKIKKAIVLTA